MDICRFVARGYKKFTIILDLGGLMPLAFHCSSHGIVSFGFFNIKTDLLLLENYFFFAEDSCNCIAKIAQNSNDDVIIENFEIYEIYPYQKIGDLGSAIEGVKYEGFIGEIYKLFPFPKDMADFKQDPEGWRNRDVVLEVLKRYAEAKHVVLEIQPKLGTVRIGRYLFSRKQFHQLLNYVWLGGYPKWLEGKRPEYVLKMKESSLLSKHSIFSGLQYG
jgi:hypothetical protein